MTTEQIVSEIIAAAKKVRLSLYPGYLESVYEKAMMVELQAMGLNASRQQPIKVYYQNTLVGDYIADIVVEGQVIVELKAVERLCVSHEAQLVNYLTATGIEHGLLINFGGATLEIRRKFRTYRKKGTYWHS